MANTPAMESIFANAQQNAASLIETATLAINAKVNTIEEAEKMIQELSTEAVMFNQLLTTIMNAMRQVESGDMQKEEAAGIITPAVKELKDKCTALKIANADAPGDDITEDEIAILRELIIGAKAAAEDRLVAIRLGDDEKSDPEIEAEVEEAEEGFISNFIERRQTAKLNKEKINTLWESFADKKSEAILSQFAKAALPLFEGKDKDLVKSFVNQMLRFDQNKNKDYSGKLSAKDYIVKSYSGISMAIMPATIDGLGCSHILAPASNSENDCFFFKKEICSIILNPVNKAEVGPAQEAYDAEVAMEAGFLAAKYVNTNDTKTAKALYSNAKKLYSLGEKDKALGYMKKAKSLYEKALNALLKSGKFEKAETVTRTLNGTVRKTSTSTDSMTFSIARASLEQKIDRCTAYVLQWTTKAGKETYQQTLDQLKAEREQAKAAKKAAKATENYDFMEGNNMILTNEYDTRLDAAAMEAMDFEAAIEGTNWNQHKMKKAYSKECRQLAKQAKRAYKNGNYSEAKGLYNKCVDLCNQFISDVKAIPQDAKDIQWGSWMYALRTMFVASDSSSDIIDRNIELLNKQGKGELTHGDMNDYTASLCNEAKRLAARYKKLADKAAKGELNQVSATEGFDADMFDYDAFMFACESYMDELELELATEAAMEAEGADEAEGGKSPSALAAKVRSAGAKLRSAFKRGDKAAVEEAQKEVNDAVQEIADGEEAAPPEKKKSWKKAVGIAAAVIATIAVIVGFVKGAKSLKDKGESVNPKTLANLARQTTSTAVKNAGNKAGQIQDNTKASIAAAKEVKGQKESIQQNVDNTMGGLSKGRKKARVNAAMKTRYADIKEIEYNKLQAQRAGKAANEAFGISAYDAYEVIFEALCEFTTEESTITDDDFVDAIEAMC